MKEGWNWLFNSRKEHYFVLGKSLCNRYMLLDTSHLSETTNNPCAICKKKLEKMRKGKSK